MGCKNNGLKQMKKEKCDRCKGTGEVEVLESDGEIFYNKIAKPALDKAYELPTWCWLIYDDERGLGRDENKKIAYYFRKYTVG